MRLNYKFGLKKVLKIHLKKFSMPLFREDNQILEIHIYCLNPC